MYRQSAGSERLLLDALGFAFAVVAFTRSAHTQTLSASATPAPAAVSLATRPKPVVNNPVPLWNFSLNESVQRDSSTGWSDILTPSISLRPDPHVSFVAALPWYPTVAAYTSTTVNGTTTTTLSQHRNVLGDASLSGFAGAGRGDFKFIAGASLGFATGDQSLGLSAGKTSWHLGAHAEYSVGPFTPDIEAGIGNSSAFATHVIRKAYTAVGRMANLQAGTNIDLPGKLSLDLEGYEAMPIQTQNLYGTIGRRNSHATGHGKRTLQGSTASGEDNGFNASIEYPLTRKLTIGTEYDTSLIQADNIVAFSLSWVLLTHRRADAAVPASPIARGGN